MPSPTVSQEDTVQANLPQHVAVQLAGALVQARADELGVRSLILKGSAATIHGYRPVLDSSDVDVLLERSDARRVIAALSHAGWRTRRTAPAPRQFELHSETLYHPEWPCDIDVHWRYPGFFSAPEVVFDALWAESEFAVIAGRRARITGVVGTALVLAVHALRDPQRARSEADLASVGERLTDDDLASRFLATAIVLRAQYPLRDLLERTGAQSVEDDLTSEERAAWDLEVESSGSTTLHWYIAFTSAPWSRRPAVALSAARALALSARGSSIGVATRADSTSRKLREAVVEIRRLHRRRRSRRE